MKQRNTHGIGNSSGNHENEKNIMNISITTNCPVLHAFLNSDIPKGVKITSNPPMERRGIDFNISVNFDIKLTIDISQILAYSFASWIVSKAITMKGIHHININSKKIPIDDPNAIDLIANEIENKKQ